MRITTTYMALLATRIAPALAAGAANAAKQAEGQRFESELSS
jgi:hypothetical protein